MVRGSVDYHIVRVIGQGAFGAVYEAERRGQGLNRRVALKLLHAGIAGRAGVERRFRDEARMLSLVRHRAIVGVEDLIQLDGAWCIVMECVPGADLAHLIQTGPLPPRPALTIAEEVASALHAAWSQAGPDGEPLRLVHRDVKPQNVRLTPQGEVKLLDFGVARADFRDREATTRNVGIGTVIYMAPERFRGEDTHAGDVYALGVTLFELLTSQPPGESAGDPDRSPPGRHLAPQWAWLQRELPEVFDVVRTMLDAVAEQRPTARDCARRLGELRSRVPGPALDEWAEVHLAITPEPQMAVTLAPLVEGSRNGPSFQVGQTFTMGEPESVAAPRRARRFPWVAAVAALGLAGVTASVVGAGGYLGLSALREGTPTGDGSDAHGNASPAKPISAHDATAPATPAPAKASSASARPVRPPQPTAASARATNDAPPATAPAPAPPDAAPTPAPEPPSPTTGRVRLIGADSAILSGSGGTHAAGSLPVGSYRAAVRFADGVEIDVPGVDVSAGGTVTLRCNDRFKTCAVE